jgi:3-dehydroquinate synthase
MSIVEVPCGSRAYLVHVGRGILGELGGVARESAGGSVAMLVSDSNVAPLYGEAARASLEAAGYEVAQVTISAGEQSKNMGTFAHILEETAQAGLTRDDLIVALGGGVVGDLAGFAAASYMRGCAVVQVPTSLLAMVDSSVGGKTAVDLSAGKNLAGAFWQPSAVLADVSCLSTLSPELFRDSLGEVIKYGVLCDTELFASLEREPLDLTDLARVEDVVVRNIEVKRDVVVADEREGGIRQTLNLGHTIGHAIEAESGYRLGHGCCVAAGLVLMARASAALGLCSEDVARRIAAVVEAHGLPTGTDLPVDVLWKRSLSDKKRHANALNVVVVRDIGAVEVRRVTLEEYRHLLELAL